MRSVLGGLAGLLIAVCLAAGCKETCPDSYCEGNVLHMCTYEERGMWSSDAVKSKQDCPSYGLRCVERNDTADCVLPELITCDYGQLALGLFYECSEDNGTAIQIVCSPTDFIKEINFTICETESEICVKRNDYSECVSNPLNECDPEIIDTELTCADETTLVSRKCNRYVHYLESAEYFQCETQSPQHICIQNNGTAACVPDGAEECDPSVIQFEKWCLDEDTIASRSCLAVGYYTETLLTECNSEETDNNKCVESDGDVNCEEIDSQ